MTATLYSSGMLNSGVGLVLAGVVGYFFGSFLEKAGFGSSRKLTGIFYLRDMSVLKVMFSAVVTALIGYHYFVALGLISPDDTYPLETFWGAQIVGGLVFGLGFVMGGWCPGTAFAGIASAKWDALVFLVGAVLGSILFNETYSLVEPLYTGGNAGTIFLPDSLGIPANWFPLLFCLAAAVAFAVSTIAERKFGGMKAEEQGDVAAHKLAAAAMLILAVGIVFLPAPGKESGLQPVTQTPTLLSAVADAEEHIEPEEVADMLMADPLALYLVDLRDAAEYERFHIRGAVSIPLAEVESRLAELPTGRRVVLYSNGTTHAAQAWLQLRVLGVRNTLVLTDGILGFWRRCLTPPSLAGYLDPAAAQAAGAVYEARRGYFIENKDTAVPEKKDEVRVMKALGLEHKLVDAAWLAGNLSNRKVKVLDVRGKSSDYSTSHIPGSVYLNVENLRTTIGGIHSMLTDAETIGRTLGRLGISSDDTVIVYSDRLQDATLIAVALDRVGHESYAILLGGIEQWLADGNPVTSAIPAVNAVKYTVHSGADKFTIDIDETEKARRKGDALILDVRPAEYFSGAKSEEARAGHIPGAVNRPYQDDLAGGRAAWRSLDELKSEYEALGVNGEKPVIIHCRTGHQASQTYFLLRHLMGLKDVRWLDASWMAWAANAELPAAK